VVVEDVSFLERPRGRRQVEERDAERKVGCLHLSILRGGTLVDTISFRDLLFDGIAERTSEVEDLKRYIQG
jgi:hypothetical protein